jgi:ubiquinone/menaquinone biosynthesis C-methylase UbiE
MGVGDPAHYLHSRLLKRALDAIDGVRPRHILDAGCGAGDYSFYLAARYPMAEVLGVDIDEEAIRRNRETARHLGIANVRFEVANLAVTKFPEQFDLVISIDVLEHIVEQETALRTLRSALRPGGTAFLHIPTVRERPVPFSRWLTGFHEWAAEEHLAKERTADEFASCVRASGLQVTSTTRTFGYFTGELATSLFALPFKNTRRNRVFQVLLMPICRLLARADSLNLQQTRYAVAVLAKKPPAPAA